jgi:hypothetical protein
MSDKDAALAAAGRSHRIRPAPDTGRFARPENANDNGVLRLSFASGPDPCGNGLSCNVTVTDSLGSAVTVTVPVPSY